MSIKISMTELLKSLTVLDLRGICWNLNLIQGGNKADLIFRIMNKTKTIEELLVNLDFRHLLSVCNILEIDDSGKKAELLERIQGHLGIKNNVVFDINVFNKYYEDLTQGSIETTISEDYPIRTTNMNHLVYKLEATIHQYNFERNINIKFDTSIYSEEIADSMIQIYSLFDKPKSKRESYYLLPSFFYIKHMASKLRRTYLMVGLAKNFFMEDEVNKKLNFMDIVVYRSGATRCKSYFLAALRTLSNSILIHNSGKKSMLPTLFGIILERIIEAEQNITDKNNNVQYFRFFEDGGNLTIFKDYIYELYRTIDNCEKCYKILFPNRKIEEDEFRTLKGILNRYSTFLKNTYFPVDNRSGTTIDEINKEVAKYKKQLSVDDDYKSIFWDVMASDQIYNKVIK